MFDRLRREESDGRSIKVALAGAGFVARGLVHQLKLTPGMRPALIIARSRQRAVDMLAANEIHEVVTSDDPTTLDRAVKRGATAIAGSPEILRDMSSIDVVVEATGDTQHGAHVALEAIGSKCHVVSLNYETDATVGPILKSFADENDVVYSGSDGDQPGVMNRLIEYVEGIGLTTVAAINCKGFLDRHATPDTIRPWAERQGTSLHMTTAFTDGTKMNVENVSVANATGLRPEKRGMHGVSTTLADAVGDFMDTLESVGVVDYTLGGDFGSGIAVIASGADPDLAAPYLKYLKMGDGPWYLFFRPWHLVQFETPISIAEAQLDHRATIAPKGPPVAEVVAIAKRDLTSGMTVDGIGGYDVYGEIDRVENTAGLLPVGLASGLTIVRDIPADQAISVEDVDPGQSPLLDLWRLQGQHFTSSNGLDLSAVLERWTRTR